MTKTRKVKASRTRKNTTCRRRDNSMFYVGTSGFMIPQQTWLSLECLNCIEINSTFYRIPTDKVVAGWKANPDRVGYVIKASKYITHIKRLNDVEDGWNRLWSSIKPLASRLKCVLFQLPPSFVNKDENVRRVEGMKKFLPNGLNVAFEFRHPSWFAKETYSMMKKRGWCVVGTYISKKEGEKWMGSMPDGLVLPPLTAKFSYMRIHGGKGFRGSLTTSQITDLRKKLISQKPSKSFVMFNNVFFDSRGSNCSLNGQKIQYAAVCNAAQFARM